MLEVHQVLPRVVVVEGEEDLPYLGEAAAAVEEEVPAYLMLKRCIAISLSECRVRLYQTRMDRRGCR